MFHVKLNNLHLKDYSLGPNTYFYPSEGFATEETAKAYVRKRAVDLYTDISEYSVYEEVEPVLMPVTTQTHYAGLKPEPITVIEGWGLSYVRGNAIKYLARAGKKDQSTEGTIQDLEKAISYIRREISTLKGGPSSWT